MMETVTVILTMTDIDSKSENKKNAFERDRQTDRNGNRDRQKLGD